MADYTDLRGRFVYQRPVYWSELDILAENDAHFEENGWEDGCKALFFQAAAPTGWTKDTTADLNGRMPRIVSGSGGATGGGSQMVGATLTLAHPHSINAESDHNHQLSHFHQWGRTYLQHGSYLNKGLCINGGKLWVKDGGGSNNSVYVICLSTANTGDGGAHGHGGATGNDLSNVSLAYADAIICARDVSSGYTDMTSAFSYGKDIDAADFTSFGENDEYNKDRLIAAGTVMLFGMAVAPTDWTKVATVDDKAMRIVTGTGGGTGGSQGLSSAITLAHNSHSVSSDGAHGHSVPNHEHPYYWSAYNFPGGIHSSFGKVAVDATGALRLRANGSSTYNTLDDETATDGGGGTMGTSATHGHTLGSALSDVTLAYMDIIQCSKDAYDTTDYTDMSAFFAADNLLAWQEMETLSQNDEWLNNNQVPAGAVAFFYQAAAPETWTKDVDVDDKAMRIVSGTGAGTGGSHALSSAITLAHSHTLNNPQHSHSTPAHSHAFKETSDPATGAFMDWWVTAPNAESSPRLAPTYTGGGGSSWEHRVNSISSSFSGGTGTKYGYSGNHGGSTVSALSNVTMAYADVIKCTKDA